MPNIVLQYLELETCNMCTRECPWCIYGQIEGFSEQKFNKLETVYIEKVLQELKSNNFKGTISFYSMNEPLLDDRIIDGSIFKICKSILGENARIKLNTNADLLTEDILETMKASGLDLMHISCYDTEILRKVQSFYKKFDEVYYRDYTGENRKILRFNRAGTIESIIGLVNSNFSSCHLPFYSTIIGHDGKVRLCAFDSLARVELGNIKEKGLFEILNSKEMKKIRVEVLNNRQNFYPCNECNFSKFH